MQRFNTLAARALRLRCPVCGEGHAMGSWFRMYDRCPHCNFALERDDGYRSGAMAANLVGTEVIVTALLLIGGITTWPQVPWNYFWIVGIVAAAVFPLAFYPLSRTLWVAMDLLFHAPEPADFRSRSRLVGGEVGVAETTRIREVANRQQAGAA